MLYVLILLFLITWAILSLINWQMASRESPLKPEKGLILDLEGWTLDDIQQTEAGLQVELSPEQMSILYSRLLRGLLNAVTSKNFLPENGDEKNGEKGSERGEPERLYL